MLSRSHVLVERELSRIARADLWGIDVSIVNDNIYEWSVRIKGPQNTPWEGGVFRVYFKFDEHYSTQAPRICFHTIPYHPNIDMITGRPCIDYLDDCNQWSPGIKMSSILLQIQNMLGNPVLHQPINTEAADMLINSPETYRKIVAECVEYSKQIDSGKFVVPGNRKYCLQNIPGANQESKKPDDQDPAKEKQATRLSFDDYLVQWNGIATSKPVLDSTNTYLELIKDQQWLRGLHLGMNEEEFIDEEYGKQVEYDNVYYGTIHESKPVSRDRGGRDSKMAKINQMRKIYLPKKPLPTPRSPTRHSDSEGEVENLVAWTQNLDAEDLNS